MPKQSFIFCRECSTMFLKSEIKSKGGKRECPNCKRFMKEGESECWEFDPFDLHSWPFREVKVSRSFHEITTNEQYECESNHWGTKVLQYVFTCMFGCVLLFSSVVSYTLKSDVFQSIILLLGSLFFILGGLVILVRNYISVDNKKLYLCKMLGKIRISEIPLSRESCSVRFSGKRDGFAFEVFLQYRDKNDENNDSIYLFWESREYKDALSKARWLSAYLKYAYNEELLPEPEAKYGKALPPAKEDKLSIAEYEKRACKHKRH